jgi:hypothetical protein
VGSARNEFIVAFWILRVIGYWTWISRGTNAFRGILLPLQLLVLVSIPQFLQKLRCPLSPLFCPLDFGIAFCNHRLKVGRTLGCIIANAPQLVT